MKAPRTDKAWGYAPNTADAALDGPCPMFKDWRYEFACKLESSLIEALEALKDARNTMNSIESCCNTNLMEDEIGELTDLIKKLEEI